MKKLFAVLFSFVTILVVSSTSVKAGAGNQYGEGGCTPVYGGGSNCPRPGAVLIDKMVANPATGTFVDNLGPNDPKYKPEQVVTFRIIVKNPGDDAIESMTVTDHMPDFVDYMSGPGTYDSKTRTLTFKLDSLAGGASQTFEVKARTVHPANFPSGKNLMCPVNTVDAVSDSQNDHDESQFCVEKQPEIVGKETPKSGPEMWIIPALSTLMGAGAYLRKKSV
jgi:uncharacterized repeat protein (TIGR01451 family)